MKSTSANSAGSRLWVKASPRGTRSGFAVLPDGVGGSVTVTVLPKPWATRVGIVREYVHAPGTTTHAVVYETEHLALSTSTPALGGLAVSLAEVSREQADLLELGGPPKDVVDVVAIAGDPFAELIDLMLLAERGRVANSRLTFEGRFAQSLLRLLTHERLLKLVEGLIFRARPRYTERTEVLEQPRGRLSERSLLFSIATGTPRVQSTFDELTVDTPLLRVIASALRVVASERLPIKIAALRPGLQARAGHLLRYLVGVRLIEREKAVLVAERLWLGPLDRSWASAVDAALPVLRDRAVVPEDGADSSDALIVHVSTEKFWEQCLELALESAFTGLAVSRNAQPGIGVDVPAPWGRPAANENTSAKFAAESFPDFMFQHSGEVVVADAKYKLGSGAGPSSQDAYQLFAYSHLARLGGRASDIALIIYPTRGGDLSSQLELERLRGRDYPLWLVRLPFPTRSDLQSQTSWIAFVSRSSRTIGDLSVDWSGRGGTAVAS